MIIPNKRKLHVLFSRLLSASVRLPLARLLTVSISTQVKQMQYSSVLTASDTLSPQYHCILMELMLDGAVPSETVQNLGDYLDSGFTMDEHPKRVSAGCYSTLRVLREAKPFVPYNIFTWWCNSFWQNLITATLCLQMLVAGLSTSTRMCWTQRQGLSLDPRTPSTSRYWKVCTG